MELRAHRAAPSQCSAIAQGAARFRPGTKNRQIGQAGARAKNPFIEYDLREKRLNQAALAQLAELLRAGPCLACAHRRYRLKEWTRCVTCQERKWLQEDSGFLEQRREDLRLGAMLNQLNIQTLCCKRPSNGHCQVFLWNLSCPGACKTLPLDLDNSFAGGLLWQSATS